MPKHKNKLSLNRTLSLVFLGLLGLALLMTFLLVGNDVTLLNPKGLIASQESRLMVFTVGFLLSIALPTIALLYFFAWKYRESNQTATYDAGKRFGRFFTFCIWGVPTLFMVVLMTVMWPAAHHLAPRKAIDSSVKPLTIQVIAMRWKWVFIYPDQKIATVNYVQIPTDVPIKFELTADDAPMSSFWIPHLSGQLYAMTGHVNELNMMAYEAGDYPGSSAEINGAGFAGMKFMARASSQKDFDIWVQRVKQTNNVLDTDTYNKLVLPSENNSVALYSATSGNLYETLLLKYNGSHNHSGTYTEHE